MSTQDSLTTPMKFVGAIIPKMKLTRRPSGVSYHSEIFATAIIAKPGDDAAAGGWLQNWAENGPKSSGE